MNLYESCKQVNKVHFYLVEFFLLLGSEKTGHLRIVANGSYLCRHYL